MIKKLIWMCALMGVTVAWADSEVKSEVVDGVTWYYRTYTENKVTYAYITSGEDKYSGDLTVPKTLGGFQVKKIGSSAFRECSTLKSIVVQSGVTKIESYAFYKCSTLTSMAMPDGLITVGSYAFYDCCSLACVTIPSSVTSIDTSGFYGCSALTNVVMSTGLTNVGPSAFYGCGALTSVLIPEGVTSIGKAAFCGCSALTRFDVPSTVQSLGDEVVRGCLSLTTLTVAAKNENYKCINNCIVSASGTTLLAVPFGCAEVVIPNGVNVVSDRMFCEDTSLINVIIPEGVSEIGNACFVGCSKLEYITFPKTLSTFCRYNSSGWSMSTSGRAFYDFYYMPALKRVRFCGPPPIGLEYAYFTYTGYNDNFVLIEYPREYGAQWQNAIELARFKGYNRRQPLVSILSSRIRENDPTILDVVYKVTSSVTNMVKVRVLAFEDGVRSFANVVRPETFVADTNGVETAGNVGDTIAANVEHTLSWKVSADWSNQLAKVSLEVLATENDLLPLEVRTIPASDQYGKMDVTWNAIEESQWFDALLWLYADQAEGLALKDGVLRNGAIELAIGADLKHNKSKTKNGSMYVYQGYTAPEYVLRKMGYTLLSGSVLDYVNEETRLGLCPSDVRQYGYKIVGDEK